MSAQVRSKQRVADHGEVFTSEREVNAMLDLVKAETENIESRFLEPACGSGNFLVEVLRRKLAVVSKRYAKNAAVWQRYAVLALTSLYGVELLADNVEECQARLYAIFKAQATRVCAEKIREGFFPAARYILERNILCGDALTLKQADGQPIIFSEWSLAQGDLIKRRDFRLDVMIEAQGQQMSFDMMPVEGSNDFVARPLREFELFEYWRVQDAE